MKKWREEENLIVERIEGRILSLNEKIMNKYGVHKSR